MSFLLSLVMVVLFLACVGFSFSEGMWTNAIRLINVIFAALLAMNYFEPLANWLDDWMRAFSYYWDFLAMWALFVVSFFVLRLLTDTISQVKVRFPKIVEQIGSGIFGVVLGGVMVGFTLTTLYAVPLGKTFLFGGFRPGQAMVLGMRPTSTGWDSSRTCRGAPCAAGSTTKIGKMKKPSSTPTCSRPATTSAAKGRRTTLLRSEALTSTSTKKP